MVLDGVSLVAAPCVSALIGIQVKVPSDFTLGRFTLSSMMGLCSLTFFSIWLHRDLLNLTMPIAGNLMVLEVLIMHFLPMACLLEALAFIVDKVNGRLTRVIAVLVVFLLGLVVAASAVLSPINVVLAWSP